MAGNKFATMVNKHTHKLVLLLIYAFLEWVLISLLLLNSLFSYLIAKFASYVGLQKPCPWCSRLDHIFENDSNHSYTDLFCESHAAEISRLVRSNDTCFDRDGDRLDRPYSTFGHAWPVKHSVNSGDGSEDEDEDEDCLSSSSMFICYEKEAIEDSKAGSNGSSGDFVPIVRCRSEKGDLVEDNRSTDCDLDRRLIPVELIDSSTVADDGNSPSPIKVLEMNEAAKAENSGSDTDSEEKKQDLLSKASEQILITTREIRALQINVKNAVMTKLIDLPGAELEEEDVAPENLASNQMYETECESETCKAQNNLGPNRTENSIAIPEPLPDTPTSIDSLNHLDKKSASAASELEVVGDSASSVEELKTALKSERKVLRALYAELEEERSASAIAASQTMAMITRLQEEKAAMQMEALQYQRMMEEQSEYDQEALQLLNDLMVKREKEKQELERELEGYRKKLVEYEEREKKKKKMKTETETKKKSSWESSDDEENEDDADVDVDLEGIALDCAKHMSVLDESLTKFEEERLSILDQLEALEEKLVKLSDKNDGENDENDGFEAKTTTTTTLGSMAKELLPFLDEVENDDDDDKDKEERSESPVSKAIEEEVGHVYERLQALEADREFLKNCMSSIKRGDKGVDLLQEILQHLRDLRSIELRMRSSNSDEDLDIFEVS